MTLRVLAVLAIAFLGMVDTLFLSLSRDAGPLPCNITHGCTDVLTSAYSEVGGIPISWIGFAFYLTVFGTAVFGAFGEVDAFRILFWPAAAALAVSVVLTGIQALVLQAYCQYCLASAGFSTAIFFLVWTGWRAERRSPEPAAPELRVRGHSPARMDSAGEKG
jgi:uncharacterized membrane protein